MKSFLIFFTLLWTLGFGPWDLLQNSFAVFVTPLPKGTFIITRDTSGHDSYIHYDDLSLDYQASKIPNLEDTNITQARCWSYGAPILASQSGTVSKVTYLSARHKEEAGYGAHVILKHNDGSIGYYAHMINDSSKIYIKKGDDVEQAQILGLMGDTGHIESGREPCLHDNNLGTHLHFELRNTGNSNPEIDNLEAPSSLETIHSETRLIDKNSLYANNHFGKYPYIPEIEQVHSVSPLVVKPGSRTQFLFKGKYFYEDSDFELPFCTDQELKLIDEQSASIDCEIIDKEGIHEAVFPNLYQKDGQLKLHFELTHNPENLNINDVQFIPPHPGEALDLSITGTGLSTDLDISVQSQSDSSQDGACDFEDQFSYLSPTKIIVRCQLPLNLGPVEQENEQELAISINKNNQTLYQDTLSINYGISSPQLSPLQATYNIPTRFSITGKNVHRSSIFFIENCENKSFKILEQLYNKVTFECFISPKTDGTSSHQFFFKTRSRFNKQGINELTDEQDKDNIILSGYITMIHDEETKVESISPNEAIIGQETLFTVTGNRLPYSDDKIPLIWMEDCQGHGKNGAVEVIPESYTHSSFQFRCTPQFSKEEQSTYLSLEQRYSIDDRKKKEELWQDFDDFFTKLKTRKLHIKTQQKNKNELLSEQTVQFISSLYDFIREEEQFQFQYLREDGLYQISGPPEIKQIEVGSISRSNRHQTIEIQGQNLPYDLKFTSNDCAQIAISYGSSENFTGICLLKKASLQELQVIDGKKEELLESFQSKLIEVYDIQASWANSTSVLLDIRGVNLLESLEISSPDCLDLKNTLEPSSSQLMMSCQIKSGKFSKIESIKLTIQSEDGVVLWNKRIQINQTKKLSTLDPRLSTLKYQALQTQSKTTDYRQQTIDHLYPDIHSPILREAVTVLTQQGLITGHTDNSFKADESYNKQTRSEFISTLVKDLPYYLEPTELSALNQFTDLSSSSKNLSEISFALLNGIIPKTTQFHPDKIMSRGEAALILYETQKLFPG